MARKLALLSLLFCSLKLAAAVTGYVVDEDGKPLAGVRVRAVAPESLEALHDRLASATPELVAIGEAQTGSDGAFRIDVKRHPVVTLLAEGSGRVPATFDAVDGDAATLQLIAAPARTGRITANGKPVANALLVLNNHFLVRTSEKGEYTLPDPNTWLFRMFVAHPGFATLEKLRGRDGWGSLDFSLDAGQQVRGRVVDPAGRPVANAIVRNAAWPVARSGEDGSFTIDHLPSNVKSLTAREGNRIGSAKPGGESIVLRPGATIAGSLRSSKDELPVAGATITARTADTPRLGSAITDAKGNFTIEGLPAAVVQLSVSHPAFNSPWTNEVPLFEGGRVDRALAATPHARLSGFVVSEDKKPVAGARVTMQGGFGVVTAPDGAFSIRWPVLDRPVLLDATKPAYASATHGPVRMDAGETRGGVRIVLPRGTKFEFRLVDADGVAIADEPIAIIRKVERDQLMPPMPLRCGATPDPMGCRSDANGKLVVNLAEDVYDIRAGGSTTIARQLVGQKLGAAESPLTIELERGVTLEGRVVWSDGTPVTTAASVSSNHGGGTPVTDGAFTMRNIPAGKTILTARTGPPSLIAGDPVEVVAPASGVVLKIPRPGRIEGRVVERDSQRAVAQFSVATESRSRMRPPSSQKAVNGSDGRFVLEDVPPGSVDVIVTAPGFVRSTTSAVEVSEGKASTVEVTLERAGTVTGRVTSGGRGVPGVSVSMPMELRGPRSGAPKQTDANGEYIVDTIPGGSHELTFRKQGYLTRSLTVNVTAGKEVRGDVELSRGRELQGRVLDMSGRPVASAEVMWGRAGRPLFETRVTSDAEGMFRLEGLPEEQTTVTARKNGYADATVDVDPATTSTVTITLDRGGEISGRVTGLSAAELQNVEVYASMIGGRGGSSNLRGRTDSAGAFTLTGTRDGEYIVTAQETRPPRRRVSAPSIKVTGGVAQFVEIDFASGITVRGRVTRRGQAVSRGQVNLSMVSPSAARTVSSSGGELGPDGSYEVRVPVAGEYRVMISLWEMSIGTTEGSRIDVRSDMTHDIDIRGGAVRARVIDAASGVPLPDANVVLTGEHRGGTDRRTDSTGRAIFDFVVDGKYTLRVHKTGYATAPREIVVQNGADVDIDVPVSRGELVVVRLVDAATGQPLVDGGVLFTDTAGKVIADRATGRELDGSQRFYIRPGDYVIRAMGRDYQQKQVPVTVPGTPLVTIELTRVKRD